MNRMETFWADRFIQIGTEEKESIGDLLNEGSIWACYLLL